MNKLIKIVITLGILIGGTWFIWTRIQPGTSKETKHQVLLESIESMGKLELVKYRLSDVLEHKELSTFLPEASVLLIIKAEAVGCIDLSKLQSSDVTLIADSVHIQLPQPEICYVKIDHQNSKVYDTKMAFFREASLVDEAYKNAEQEIQKQVRKSDIIEQTRINAVHVLRPLINGLGYQKIGISFN